MRPIVINARAASRPELGGVERWAREMVARLPRLDSRYLVARPPARLVHRAGHAWEQIVLPARAAHAHARLLLCPANLAPLAWPQNVVIIHDTAALRCERWYSPSYVAWQRVLLPRIARRARHVVTVSQFSRLEIIDLLGLAPEQVSVVAGGVDSRFHAADPEPVRRALGLKRPYVLTVASATARKNLGALAESARRLGDRGVELVYAGGGRPQFQSGRGDHCALRTLGHVDDRLLPGLYAGAEAFVLPSLYEGFGLTCLEAMAAGVPVVAADRGALPETCAGAALFVDPENPMAIAAALQRVLDDDRLRRELCEAGSRRARSLTWDRTAEAIDCLCRALAG